jgi:hypothetical protein
MGSIPAEGSSSNITLGFPISEIATDNFRLLPPDKFYDFLFLSRVKPRDDRSRSVSFFSLNIPLTLA